MRRFLLPTAALLVFAATLFGACGPGGGPKRGAWWYLHPPPSTDPWGIHAAFADATGGVRQQVLDGLAACQVRRLYGSYGILAEAQQADVAAWNLELRSQGIASYFLISDNDALFDPAALLERIDERVIALNQAYAASPLHQFAGVHLDVEPQALPACKQGDPGQDPVACHALFESLRLLVAEVRAHLDAYAPELELDIDLPVWVDRVDPGAKVGWPTPAEASRELWFQSLEAGLDRVVLMAYGEDDLVDLWTSVEWEVQSLAIPVRVGLDVEDGGVFPEVPALLAAAFGLETQHAVRTDLHSLNEVLDLGGCGD